MPESLELAREWDLIRKSGKGDGILEVPSRPTEVSTGFGMVRAATGPAGEPRLLIPIGRPGKGNISAGNCNLTVGHAFYRSGGQGLHFLDLILKESRLANVFADLAEEILKRIEAGEAPETAVQGTIEDFRKLLAITPRTEIPLSELAGLIGELMILERLSAENPNAVSSWTGPLSQRHDFRRGDFALEVKTSTRADASRVQIHGSDQLLPPTGAELFLAHVRIEQTGRGDLTVAGLRQRIIELGVNETTLDIRLSAMGCREPQDEDWNGTAFSLEGMDIYTVREGFPRIVSSSFPGAAFPSGIVSLEYGIDLSHASEYRLNDTASRDIIRRFAL
ncbi:PD-(D/E)XK motif protein [Cobetia crustatorum]|uniref:PD-(D/E)XK motif protein n=1 Tax=Cobetia crustatorum TaxID=553385 RepID=A0A558HS06_9GAMM|nr:PD-(D/E)XK motif protein [Cobetia crustatorum]TVU71874.1 PD-(D/E)XK motif protein [Cobetia crustatorum]